MIVICASLAPSLHTVHRIFEAVVTKALVIVKDWEAAEAVVNPVKVAAPARESIVEAAVGEACVSTAVLTLNNPAVVPLVKLIPPVPLDRFRVDVDVWLPTVTVFAAAPVPMANVVAEASLEIDRAPTPLFTVRAPPVAVILRAPEPDCNVVAEVVFVLPRVNALTPAPVATLTVVAVASVLIPMVPVPELIVMAPVVAKDRPPLPD